MKQCKGCGIRFTPVDGRQRYHSPECRTAYYTEHFSSINATKTCPNCGASFTTTMPKKQTYCSPECREQAKQQREDELSARVTAERLTYLSERYATLKRDNFRCVWCGKSVEQGAVLDVVVDQAILKTTCLECKMGKEFLGEK